MYLSKILGAVLILLCILFLGLQYQTLEYEASGVRALGLIVLLCLYLFNGNNRHPLFLLFLLFFTFAEVINYMTFPFEFPPLDDIDYMYYVSNVISILAYTFLILRILSGINIYKAIAKFPIQSILLVVLSVFVVYLVTDTTGADLDFYEYTLEFTYNTVVIILMSLSLLYYMLKEDLKSMNLLIGSICILFYEILQLAYYYIEKSEVLNLFCSLFFVTAFYFYYLQSRLKHVEIVEYSDKSQRLDL
ncbi:MAG: hypothetical protein WA775_11655 [Psychroserpens sp.]|uniref:hypothetical protein n=1 Tax=Psychroserpens sp. TaxID=2020870 RepID=UPI003C814CF3